MSFFATMRTARDIFGQRLGSARTVAALSILTILVIFASIRMLRGPSDGGDPLPQEAQQVESHAFYIAQTALDRSIKALVADPQWRDGFKQVPFEEGRYNVRVYDAQHEESDPPTPLPPNYVRIVASSEVQGVVKEVEAVWVNAMSAFDNAYSAGRLIELHNHGARDIVVLGDIHSNGWNGGGVEVHGGIRLYGDVTSVGSVEVGAGENPNATRIYGNVWARRIDIARNGAIEAFDNLNEWNEGIDLNGDGDATDIGVGSQPLVVVAADRLSSGGHPVAGGQTDRRVGGGNVAVVTGSENLGPIVDPRPDFVAYYEMASGVATYPPPREHLSSHILGDGDGHYFSSADAFTEWLRFQTPKQAACWRCAGDQRIDPGNTTTCPTCSGTGRVPATVVSGVFYIDDDVLDLSEYGGDIIVHGTIVVAAGNPYDWPAKKIAVPGGEAEILHFPEKGSFVIAGPNRMNFTQTYRSDQEAADYNLRGKTILGGENAQTVSVLEPDREHYLRDYPAILAADAITIQPRGEGFAYHPGDIGDERLTVLEGVVYAENEVRLHGHGGFKGEKMIFNEMEPRAATDALDEPVLNIDLNGDHDVFDRVELPAITTIPVIPLPDGGYTVDINNDGVLGDVTIGIDYLAFFDQGSYAYPTLIYIEGLVLGQSIHTCEQALVVHDPAIAKSGIPFGFEVSFGSTTYQGLVFWREVGSGEPPGP